MVIFYRFIIQRFFHRYYVGDFYLRFLKQKICKKINYMLQSNYRHNEIKLIFIVDLMYENENKVNDCTIGICFGIGGYSV